MYVSNGYIKIGSAVRTPGQPVSEATVWPSRVRDAYLRQRQIVDVDERTAEVMRKTHERNEMIAQNKAAEERLIELSATVETLERRVNVIAEEYEEARAELSEARAQLDLLVGKKPKK